MTFPIFRLDPVDLAAVWRIIDKYPPMRDKRYEFKVSIFGITFRPNASVKGILKDIFGDRPA